jgi:hypothetical protein
MRVPFFSVYAGAAVLLLGCDPAVVEAPLDLDHDGLLSDIEEEIGSDPLNEDSDGDGHLDGSEYENGTDPNDASDHPYMGGWQVNRCETDPLPSGNGIGDVTQDFALTDQFGEEVSLYDFCKNTVLLITGTYW